MTDTPNGRKSPAATTNGTDRKGLSRKCHLRR